MSAQTFCSVVTLYRAYIRQVRRLPLTYLRQFFRLKASDDFRALLRSNNKSSHESRVKRVSKDLRVIGAANDGNTKAFGRILDIAYGRKGKLRWEIMEPLLSDANANVPPRIIPSTEMSYPPIYPPELKALLMSNHSRRTKALSYKSLAFPPTLPLRADPFSEDARLLGPLSKRREVNIRWRYFTQEWKKVQPPLQLVTETVTPRGIRRHTLPQHLLAAGVRGMGMQGYGVFEEVEALVGLPNSPKAPICTKLSCVAVDATNNASGRTRHPSRWLRRRYQELLGRLPVITYSSYASKNGQTSGKYSVSLSSGAIAPSLRLDSSRLPQVSAATDKEWLILATKIDEKKKSIL